MKKDQKQRMMDLGEEALAQALIDLAGHSDTAKAIIHRLIATPDEAVAQFRNKLASLKRSRRFIDWRESGHFAGELESLLDDLQASVSDPLMGVELVVAFFGLDNNVFERCDDSSGYVRGAFGRAHEVFVEYAKACDDKKRIAALLLKLCKVDDYGVRASLVDSALECGLSEPIIRSMITELQKRGEEDGDEYKKQHHFRLVEFLARQIKDAGLFEAARLAARGELSTAAYIDIAQVYFEQGDIETASSRLKQIPEKESFQADKRDKLWLEIYQKQGDTEKLTHLLYQRFQGYRSVDSLQGLLDVIGVDKRNEVLSKEIALIFKQAELNSLDANFLIAIDHIDDAEAYLLKHADEINGNFYGDTLSLAKVMEAENRMLIASLIYRSLLQSILTRAYSKAYSHGVRYLKKLDKLTSLVEDWKGFDSHDTFKGNIYQVHGRKRSFWSKYEISR